MPDHLIPAHIVTGATGSGKTTFISRLIAHRASAEQWAVLVNDFGDAKLDASASVSSREVAGCICCTAHVALRAALVSLLREARPQRVLIEASAAARPAALMKVLSEPGLSAAIELKNTICVVAAEQLANAAYASNDIYREQIDTADFILVSGANGADGAVRARIAGLRRSPARYLDPANLDAAAFNA